MQDALDTFVLIGDRACSSIWAGAERLTLAIYVEDHHLHLAHTTRASTDVFASCIMRVIGGRHTLDGILLVRSSEDVLETWILAAIETQLSIGRQFFTTKLGVQKEGYVYSLSTKIRFCPSTFRIRQSLVTYPRRFNKHDGHQ